MEIEIRKLRRKDYKKAIRAAIKGMHFYWYMDSPLLLDLYGRYFWYLELSRATQVLVAQTGGKFAGVLLAEMKGEKKAYCSLWRHFYIKAAEFMQKLLFQGSAGAYEKVNLELYAQYSGSHSPDGEILFLAADPEIAGKGTGSKLLDEFERREAGKEVYLYTDNACTYQFYEHRGFECSCKKEIVLEFKKKKVPLQCMLYSKVIKERGTFQP